MRCMTSSQVTRGGAMADQGERYIYQRFPYVVLDDTPSSSSDSDSDPSEVSAAASQADIPLPQTPPAPVPAPVPPPPPAFPIIPSPPHSPPVDPAADRGQSISPPRVPAWDGLRRMRGQARKTTGLPPRHQMAPRDEPQAEPYQWRDQRRRLGLQSTNLFMKLRPRKGRTIKGNQEQKTSYRWKMKIRVSRNQPVISNRRKREKKVVSQ
ncbi:hypothetical protein E3N88_05690 [Mikania micrantha]|uniref:Uncharacterized protein n=1 Tax=Mikania micrantha TaxID=192012 RepID=A0A5N6PLM8_9ASTR|nr:hypothetical protein E3N88_05690 [Mikania micrantha]